LKTGTDIAQLAQEDDSLITKEKQKVDELNNCFSSLFTQEDTFTSHTDSKLVDVPDGLHSEN